MDSLDVHFVGFLPEKSKHLRDKLRRIMRTFAADFEAAPGGRSSQVAKSTLTVPRHPPQHTLPKMTRKIAIEAPK